MSTLRIALAQVDLTVGDIAANCELVLRNATRAAAAGADLVVFPEMTLTGYPPEDLVLRQSFRRASMQAVHTLAADLAKAGLGDIAVVVGYLDDDGEPRNAAAFIHGGSVVARYYKHHLPNYGVFDEYRYFRAGAEVPVIEFAGVNIALTICEDVWQDGGPFSAVAGQADVIVNINGSPYERGKHELRLDLVSRRAAEAGAAVVYVNQVGGQDELVFDGDSFIVDAHGGLQARAPQFIADLYVHDLDVATDLGSASVSDPGMRFTPQPADTDALAVHRYATSATAIGNVAKQRVSERIDLGIAAPVPDAEEVWRALVLGTRDYARKNGFSSVVLGMSGGIDSAVVAAIAADAIGGENVYGVALPSEYSSAHSLADAADLAQRLGAHYRVVEIAPMVKAFVDGLSLTGLAEENVQARVRGTTLMGLSNSDGHLVLATGNKSELSVGYSTIYGDAVGGFAPIKDLPKTSVWELAQWRNAHAEEHGQTPPIPPNSISKEPSAELRPGQLDSDSLPDYAVLDAVLARYVDTDAGLDELVADGFDVDLATRIVRMTDAAEWKRRQYPPGPKISMKAFGRDRRLPITNRWRENY